MKVQVVSYHDVGRGYESEVNRLKASLREHEIPHRIYELPKFPTWADAVAYKPKMILEAMRHHKSYDGLLYVDADAKFTMKPDMDVFDGVHLAVHYFQRSKHHKVETLTGTMYVANTPKVWQFLEDWHEETKRWKRSPTPEQNSLKTLLDNRPDDFIVGDLDPTYVWIYDDFPVIYGNRDPVIIHYQASRRLRRNK